MSKVRSYLNLVIQASAISLTLVACASSPRLASNSAGTDVVIKPSYNEKVGAVSVEDLNTSTKCAHDLSFEKLDWRKQVAMASACVKAGDWTRTDKIGSSLAIHAPLTPWGPYYMALAASSRKDFPRAQWMLELALKKAPGEGIFHYELGRLNWELHDEATAVKEMKLASDLNPALTDAHYTMGRLALQKGDLSEARRYLRKALNNEPKNIPSLMTMAQVEMKASDWNKAELLLNSAISVNPRSSKARWALAQVQEQHLKKVGEALSNYKALRQLSAEHKLDEPVQGFNLDEKIQTLEKSLSQVNKGSQLTERKPSAERQVSQ